MRRPGGRAARQALRAAKPSADERPVRPGFVGGQYKPLSDEEMVRIHRAALRVLEQTGMSHAIPSCVERVTAAGGWVNGDGRLCFPPSLVEDMMTKVRRAWVLHGQDPAHDLELSGRKVQFGTAGAAVHMLDFHSREYRESSLADLYDILRLVDTLDNIHWCLRPVVARDMTRPVDLDINTAYAILTGTTKPSGLSFSLPGTVAPIVDMFDMALGGEGRFREKPFAHFLSGYVIPPLRFAEEACETLEIAARLGVPVLLGSVPQAGATSPASLAGTLVQTIAEELAGLVYVNLVVPGHRALFSCWPFVSDLRTGAFSGGGGEQALLMAAVAQMGSGFYDMPCSVAAGMTDSKVPDAQAGFEKGYTTALAGLAGPNMVHESAGMLASLLAVSLESFVIDNDMLGAVQRTVRGIEVSDEALSVEVIHECATGPGHYLGHPQTLALMERDYVYPRVSDRLSPDAWRQAGSHNVVDRARDYVRATLGTHYPSHIGAALDARIRDRYDIRLPREFMRPGSGRW